jgi:hypothetical protein
VIRQNHHRSERSHFLILRPRRADDFSQVGNLLLQRGALTNLALSNSRDIN